MIEVWFDGSCGPNNPGGTMGFGAVIKRDGEVLKVIEGMLPADPGNSNNVAEYLALLAALEWLLPELSEERIHVRGDSRLVIKQMWGGWKIRGGLYAAQAREAKELLKKFPRVTGEWVNREKNAQADALSRGETDGEGQ